MAKRPVEQLKCGGKALTDQEYLGLKTIENRLRYLFTSYKVPGTFEDFCQRYHEDIVSGYRHHQMLEHYTVDYIREKLGRTGIKKDAELILEHMPWMDKSTSDEHFHSLLEIKDEVEQHKGRARVAMALILIYGFDLTEVAFVMGVSPARISLFVEACLKYKKVKWDWNEEELEESSKELRKKIKQAADILNVPVVWLADKLREEKEDVQTH
jgi:glutaredoxin